MKTLSRALFEEIRPEFFRVLCGPAARLYVDVLDVLDRAAAAQVSGIERDNALAIVEEAVEAHLDTPLDENAPTLASTRERARLALDVLVQAGWLEEEQRTDWQRQLHFHPSGFAVMRVLRELAFPAAFVFSDKLVGVCTTLARRDPANDPMLNEPWQHVESCVTSLQAGIAELRGMQKAIEKHTREQLAATTLRENLSVLFDQFAENIGHACYSELVRARLPVRLADARLRVHELERDTEVLGKMQAEVMRRDQVLTPPTAMSRVRLRLDELAQLLDSVLPVAGAVDRRTAEFTRRSLARFRYLQETTSQKREQVQEFFEILNRYFAGRRVSEIDEKEIGIPQMRIHEARLLAGLESLYTPRLRRTASEVDPMEDESSATQQGNVIGQLQTAMRDSLTVARANRFVERILPEPNTSILSKDIPLAGTDDLGDVLASLVHAGARDARYRVISHADLEGTGYDPKLDYLIERFTLFRK